MATAIDTKPTPITNQHMVVTIKGKILRTRRYDGQIRTTLVTPASDAYSRPSLVEVRSKSRLGDIDEETIVSAKLGGYERKHFFATDPETGEQVKVFPIENILEVAE